MGITTIKRVENRSSASVKLLDIDNDKVTDIGAALGPGDHRAVDMNVPWARKEREFPKHHLELQLALTGQKSYQTRFWIWQGERADGDYVRFSSDGSWHDPGCRVYGISAVGRPEFPGDGDRTLVVWDGGFELVGLDPVSAALTSLRTLLLLRRYRISGTPVNRQIPSIPKRFSVAFSMAGRPSDAFAEGKQGARLLYLDSGKRYEFELQNGVVSVTHPDRTTTKLTDAVSFANKRAGEQSTAPPFDLIASGGGRVFAKEKDWDRFYFASMDHMFIHAGEDSHEFPVPSTYFKLDPECGLTSARIEDLTAHLKGCFADHPAAERFPLFRLVLAENFMDFMIVPVQRRKWQLIDVRPPLNVLNWQVLCLEMIRQEFSFLQLSWPFLAPLTEELERIKGNLQRVNQDLLQKEMAPAQWLPTYEHVHYSEGTGSIALKSIKYQKVLDIGVGHVHYHEVYERVTGGELQPMRAAPILSTPVGSIDYAFLYRIFNGPIRNADGYIDGTCNFYALVQIKPDEEIAKDRRDAYGLLYIDEQSYFTQRWRLVHPEDYHGLLFALVVDLQRNPSLYNWKPETYWCPFRAGHIGPASRLAVSRQVLLVTGEDPDTKAAVIYSINFSYSSMDRTWRWRTLPARAELFDAKAVARGDEPITIPKVGTDCVYPQTIRLREDMTIHLKGTRGGTIGRWYQRYLPAANQLVPPADQLVPGRPSQGYTHPWKFLAENVFLAADQFSHFGVYDTVDSRAQYYLVEPASDADAQTLSAGEAGPWVFSPGGASFDEHRQLYVNTWKFWWAAPLRLPDVRVDLWNGYLGPPPKCPPSLFNPDTRLRIVKRGSGWIATHWDKRDDTLMPFERLPKTVELNNGPRRVKVTLQSNTWSEEPPTVKAAEFVWTADPNFPVALALIGAYNVWRVRLAALDLDRLHPDRPPRVVSLLDVEMERFTPVMTDDGFYGLEYSWKPTPSQLAELEGYCTRDRAMQCGTSIWCEDRLGHVSVPEEVRWLRTMRAKVTPSALPLGMPVQVTVHAEDAGTSARLAGIVEVNDQMANKGVHVIGNTDKPFTYTFKSHVERTPDPERKGHPTVEEIFPTGTVTVDGYRDGVIPFTFYEPSKLAVSIEPSPIPMGRPVQVTVRAKDPKTRALVAGKVMIGVQQVADTNTPFSYTFLGPAAPAGMVSATGYPDAAIPWPPLQPSQFQVRVQPLSLPLRKQIQVIVHAEDSFTHGAVKATVTIHNFDAGGRQVDVQFPANAPYAITFRTHVVRGPHGVPPETQEPTGTVSAPGYQDADIPLSWAEPAPLNQLSVRVTPSPIPEGKAVAVTVHAEDAQNHKAVVGTVKIGGQAAGNTNSPFSYTFGATAPIGSVSASGYQDAPIPWPPLQLSQLQVHVEPTSIPLKKPVQLTIHAEDGLTHAPVAATVTIHNFDAGGRQVDVQFPANAPHAITFHTHVVRGPHGVPPETQEPSGTVSAPGYHDADIPFGWS